MAHKCFSGNLVAAFRLHARAAVGVPETAETSVSSLTDCRRKSRINQRCQNHAYDFDDL